ncbi:cell division FtsA domain-containing protein [Thermosediminibacter litoriperuensis]|uniref:Cell division protein FtsA n=1 Tax=Thermosediminibacter litoriperuensis TaxID=291989 RepID=A0A5S5AW88_9FIRM|nr:cell division FtsA domain-containing protein [Thermosediminibacter litoriperuensis]TYP57609.1 cell division protein FtsA [Thermosediminibacter litoriperuensis]
MDREVFALDIGTRTVVGVVLYKEGREFIIKDYEVLEHESRAMYDGQIHDVEVVAESVRRVKENLEKRLGYELKKAAVAAAGRALVTVEARAEKTISPFKEIDGNDIRSLEADALGKAIKSISGKNTQEAFLDYHCVGYSVIRWYLEGEPIENLLGQKGRNISVDIVATFLPRSVVESLIAVLRRCGLELDSITLEPIAASFLAVPPGMRRLNLALVDIGAGTSDIALSRDGSIFAYGMVPMAGDEITEKICEAFLLDFAEGERVKRELLTRDRIEFTDILGLCRQLESREIMETVKEAVWDLSARIAGRILELNGRPPAAVLCVGGGSLLPGLQEAIAANLEIPKDRVGVKTLESIQFVKGCGSGLSGPFAVTPVGIGANALEGTTLSFIKVYVNDGAVHILGRDKPTVFQALIHAGFSSARIFGLPGPALTFRLNGELKVVPGSLGKPAVITVDGLQAGLDDPVKEGARIMIEEARPGDPGRARVRDFINDEHRVLIYINGREIPVEPLVEINDREAGPQDEITGDSSVVIRKRELIVSDIFNIIDFDLRGVSGCLVIKVNKRPATFTTPLSNGDAVEIFWENVPV